MITFKWIRYANLTLDQLYCILQIRFKVFVEEQQCCYLDPDGEDQKAIHLLGIENEEIVAYLRLFPPTKEQPYLLFGRVLTSLSVRKKGYGKALMQELLTYCEINYPNLSILCSAQFYLKSFYESFGFSAEGEPYEEAEIQHIKMKRNP